MKKRWIAALAVLALVLLPAPARAAGADYSAGARLTGAEREVYEYIRAEAAKVAVARRTDTLFRIPDIAGLSWSLEELGAAGMDWNEDWDYINPRVRARFLEVFNFEKVNKCLLFDCPYELFWENGHHRLTWGYGLRGDRIYISQIEVRYSVAERYRGDSETTTKPYNLGMAGWALDNAKEIVERHRDKSDYDKLAAYRDEICQLVSYNYEAAESEATLFGDPWQMVYVFDLDPSTNVVCEGYAKAFKYLCDLSQFEGDVACRIAAGTMDGGLHMWNVVRMGDGKNYLVDVTNSDSGMIGANGQLFLSGAEGSANGQSYTVSKGSWRSVYTYDPLMEGMYTDSYLPLSSTDYVDTSTPTPTPTPTPSPEPSPAPTIPLFGIAHPSTQTVDLDGALVEFQMYALRDDDGNPTNYIKVRDLALALNNTKARFSVNWDGAVKLVAGEAYAPDGSENSTPFRGVQFYTLPGNPTYVNGAASDLVAFSLMDGGYTYYQLRDLGQKLGFNVRWDSERSVVCVETDKPYTG